MKIIAHRGYSKVAPENTLSSTKAALNAGSGGIELDLHMTKDLIPIVIHDENLSRTTNGQGLVSNLTLKEIKKFDAGFWFSSEFIGEEVPTFEEMIKLVDKKVTLYIEIKPNNKCSAILIEKVIDIIKKYDISDCIEIISYYDQHFKIVKSLNKNIKLRKLISVYINHFPIWIDKTIRFSKLSTLDFVDAFNIDYFVTDNLIDYIHSLEKKITVGSFPKINTTRFLELEQKGIEGIMRNDVKPYLELL
jgi:glycerophosphoryl diester phosphodiesterase